MTPKERPCAYVYTRICVWLAVRGQGVLREGRLRDRTHSLTFPEKGIESKEQERGFLPAARSCAETQSPFSFSDLKENFPLLSCASQKRTSINAYLTRKY